MRENEISDFIQDSSKVLQIFSVSQERSWTTLDVSREMFETLLKAYTVFPQFWRCVVTFGRKSEENEFEFPGFRAKCSRNSGATNCETFGMHTLDSEMRMKAESPCWSGYRVSLRSSSGRAKSSRIEWGSVTLVHPSNGCILQTLFIGGPIARHRTQRRRLQTEVDIYFYIVGTVTSLRAPTGTLPPNERFRRTTLTLGGAPAIHRRKLRKLDWLYGISRRKNARTGKMPLAKFRVNYTNFAIRQSRTE